MKKIVAVLEFVTLVVVIGLFVALLLAGCTTNNYSTTIDSGDDESLGVAGSTATGGTSSAGGSVAAVAGSPATGGTSSAGGSVASVAGSPATGGASSAGGAVASVAGSPATGGSTCVWIPLSSVAGSPATGGASSAGGARAVSSSSTVAKYPECLKSGTCGTCARIVGDDDQCDTYQRCFIVQGCSPLSSCATERQVSVNGTLQGQCSVVGVQMDCRCAL